MRFILHQTLESFVASVSPFLEANEPENNFILGLAAQQLGQPLPPGMFMGEIRSGDTCDCVGFLQKTALFITRGPLPAITTLAREVARRNFRPPAVFGPPEEAAEFAREFCRLRPCQNKIAFKNRLYKVERVVAPSGVPGTARRMEPRDVPLVAQWLFEFHQEVFPEEEHKMETALADAEKRPAAGLTYLWEVDGEVVAMAALARPTKHGFTVNAVYTPPSARGKGFASAVSAAVSEEGLRRGKKFCSLYTDLANPTANSIYQKIGYQSVGDAHNIKFLYEAPTS